MYNHRIISLIVFTTAFWTTQMTLALFAWAALSFLAAGNPQQLPPSSSFGAGPSRPILSGAESEFKSEPPSDSASTFAPVPFIKKEEDDEDEKKLSPRTPLGPPTPGGAGDADDEHGLDDDEDEDADYVGGSLASFPPRSPTSSASSGLDSLRDRSRGGVRFRRRSGGRGASFGGGGMASSPGRDDYEEDEDSVEGLGRRRG